MATSTRKASIARNSEHRVSLFDLGVSNSCSFGFEDEISQPQIEGLDPPPKAGEQRAIPPG